MNAKKIITDAAFSLFEEQPFEKITVQQILDKAEVSRATFYKYFADKYELMTLYYKEFADHNTLFDFNGHNFEDTLCGLFEFIEKNRAYFLHVKETEGPNSFWDFLRKYSYRFYGSIKCHNEGRDYLEEKERLTIILFVAGNIAVLKEIIDDKVILDRRELAELMSSVMPVSYKEILDDKPFIYEPLDYDE